LLLLVVANTGILGPGRRKFGSCWVHERWTRTLDFFVRNCVVSLLFSVHDLRLVHNSGTVMMLLMIKKSKENNAYNCPPVCEQNIWKTIWGVACQLNFVHTLTQTHSWMERRVLACDERFNICTHVQIFGMQKGQFKQVSWVSWKIIFGPMRKMGENKMKTWLKDLKVLTWLNLCWLTSLGRRHNALGHGKICVQPPFVAALMFLPLFLHIEDTGSPHENPWCTFNLGFSNDIRGRPDMVFWVSNVSPPVLSFN